MALYQTTGGDNWTDHTSLRVRNNTMLRGTLPLNLTSLTVLETFHYDRTDLRIRADGEDPLPQGRIKRTPAPKCRPSIGP